MATIDDPMSFCALGVFADPDDTPTDAQRAGFWASYGLLGDLPDKAVTDVGPGGFMYFMTGTRVL